VTSTNLGFAPGRIRSNNENCLTLLAWRAKLDNQLDLVQQKLIEASATSQTDADIAIAKDLRVDRKFASALSSETFSRSQWLWSTSCALWRCNRTGWMNSNLALQVGSDMRSLMRLSVRLRSLLP
jgi:hypothetical protein